MVVELLSALALLAPGERAVPCAEVIDQTRFPYLGNRDPRYRARLVVDTFSVPPALIPQSSPTGERVWTHFSKWGLVIRGGPGEIVTVTVPRAWRKRVAISWGNAGHGVFHTLRFARCGRDQTIGHAFAGGFFLPRASGCVPLRFRAGARSSVVWFGIVRRCAR
jgi:hypothetical protein